MPHVCGDEPKAMIRDYLVRGSMPHVCGDEPDAAGEKTQTAAVCPTYVGMNRQHQGTSR